MRRELYETAHVVLTFNVRGDGILAEATGAGRNALASSLRRASRALWRLHFWHQLPEVKYLRTMIS